MSRPKIPNRVLKIIEGRIEDLFDRVKAKFLGTRDKTLMISFNRSLSALGLYESGLIEEGGTPDLETITKLVDTSKNYIDGLKLKAINQIINDLTMHVEAGKSTPESIEDTLKESWQKVTSHLATIIDSEAQVAKNTGLLSGIVRSNASVGVEDPIVFFITAKDNLVCPDCKRLHLMEDGITPRLWYLSEVAKGYVNKKTSEVPSIHGPHPSCRCLYDGTAPVMTESGVKKIKNVQVGDRVLTHTGKFKKVIGTFGDKGLPVDPKEPLYRIEFKAPNGKVHKLRVTPDHLMLTQDGWIRADRLDSRLHKLKYLFKQCEYCKKSMSYDVHNSDRRFCSIECVGKSKIGKVGPAFGYSFENVEILRIVKVTRKSHKARIYDITVEDDSSFVVMGVVSHNCAMTTILPDYGFVNGRVKFISNGFNALEDQRKSGS